METHSDEFPVMSMARVLEVSRSGYYKYLKLKKENKSRYPAEMLEKVYTIWKSNRRLYGGIKLTKMVKLRDPRIGIRRVRNVMKLLKIKGKQDRRYRIMTTDSNHNSIVKRDLVRRNFSPERKNKIWVSDVTFIETLNKKHVYLCVILDLFSRMVVGWEISERNDTGLLKSATIKAIEFRNPDSGLVLHSDLGSNYCSNEFREYLNDNTIISSNSRKGNCWDNAVAESFFSILKREMESNIYYDIYDARNEISEYIELFYNRQRIHSFLDYKSPYEYEELAS
jgi:transposase InsO family protein